MRVMRESPKFSPDFLLYMKPFRSDVCAETDVIIDIRKNTERNFCMAQYENGLICLLYIQKLEAFVKCRHILDTTDSY